MLIQYVPLSVSHDHCFTINIDCPSLLEVFPSSIHSWSLQVRLYLLFLQRPSRRLPTHRLLTCTKPYIPRELLAQHVHDRRYNRQNREQGRVADKRHQQDIDPVLQTNRRKVNASQAANGPPNKTVDEVDGEDVREEQEERFSREEPLGPDGNFDDKLRTDAAD